MINKELKEKTLKFFGKDDELGNAILVYFGAVALVEKTQQDCLNEQKDFLNPLFEASFPGMTYDESWKGGKGDDWEDKVRKWEDDHMVADYCDSVVAKWKGARDAVIQGAEKIRLDLIETLFTDTEKERAGMGKDWDDMKEKFKKGNYAFEHFLFKLVGFDGHRVYEEAI